MRKTGWGWSVFCGVMLAWGAADAAPRMDTGVGSVDPLLATVLPDHENPNLFYVFPQTSEMTTKADGRYEFLYIENRQYRTWGRDRILGAEARVWIRPSIESAVLQQKIAEIKAANPAARFAVVSVFKTEVKTANTTDRYFLQTECSPVSGPIEVPVFCRLAIQPHLATSFKTLMKHTQARVFHYVYHFYGVSDGKMQAYQFAVPLKMGSLRGASYFVDQYGEDLD